MADPAIQTFCCIKLHRKSTPAFYAMMEFNSSAYNIVCLLSSFVGIVGAANQVLSGHKYLHQKHRWVSLVCLRGCKITVWLAFADFLAAFGVFVRSIVNLNASLIMKILDDNLTSFVCTFFGAWIQYWYCATWMWTLSYTIDVGRALQDKPDRTIFYHLFCWVIPAILTTFSVLYLFYPDATCLQFDSSGSLFINTLPNYFANYLPMISVMIINPLLYYQAGKHIRSMVWQGLAQYTNKEREIVESTYMIFTLINVVFYICWLPNLISTILIWTMWQNLPVRIVTILWYTMAIMNPLQALFNCFVYSHLSKKMNVPWVPLQSKFSESTPLLSTNSQASIT